MTCTRCGAWQSEVNASTRFCANCGATLPISAYQSPQDPSPQNHPQNQPTYVQPAYGQPPVYGGYDDAVPGLAHEPVAPARPPKAPTERDWMRSPGTWIIAATALLVAGIVLAAVIISTGSPSQSSKTDVAAAPASVSAPATTSSAPPSTATQTVVVVPAAPGTPAETRTVTVAPDRPAGSGSGAFSDSTEVDSGYYLTGNGLYFDSPSHNIGCRLVYGGSEAQCTIKDYSFSEPGHDCDLGAGVLMDAGSSPTIDCINNAPYSGGAVLEYGESVTYGGFSCVSRASGVTCLDANGSGFTLSREQYSEY